VLYRIRHVLASFVGWPVIDRRHAAGWYLRGRGIEVGALHNPTAIPRGVRVRYVDRMTVQGLREQYPELASQKLVAVDVVDDGQRLCTFADSSEDFVIESHMLEHAEDPISTIENAMRVLKPGGVLLLSIPDKRYTFDKDRPVTSLEHLQDDRADGGAASRESHFREWIRLKEGLEGFDAEARLEDMLATDQSIHFHVWTYQEMLELVLFMRSKIGFEVELVARYSEEVVIVLRKADGE